MENVTEKEEDSLIEEEAQKDSQEESQEEFQNVVNASEQRVYERFRMNSKAFIRLSDGGVVQGQAVDISMGGIYIEYGAAAEVGKVFELAFDLAFTNDFQRVLVKGRIVRSVVIGSRGVYGLAFVFTEFAKETDKILEKYMEYRKQQT